MRQYFILDDRGVCLNIDRFDSEGGDFSEEDTAEGIGNGGVDVDEVEFSREGCVAVEFDSEDLVGEVLVGYGGAEGGGGRGTSLNLLISQAWSSFGQ